METKGGPEISKRWLLVFQVLPSDIISEGKEDGDLESNFEALFFILLNTRIRSLWPLMTG